jgi:hypothetical protein
VKGGKTHQIAKGSVFWCIASETAGSSTMGTWNCHGKIASTWQMFCHLVETLQEEGRIVVADGKWNLAILGRESPAALDLGVDQKR